MQIQKWKRRKRVFWHESFAVQWNDAKIFTAHCPCDDLWCMIEGMIASNEELIHELRSLGYLKTDRLAEAFIAADRKFFVPEAMSEHAYLNEPLPIGEGQTISQPLVVAMMLEFLDIKAGEKILEIGTGSGWQTALCALVAYDERTSGSNGGWDVVSIERIATLHTAATAAIRAWNKGLSERIVFLQGDGARGDAEHMPYDKIISGASAADDIPQAWKDQLKIGGRIVAPVKNSIVVLDKTGKNDFLKRDFLGYSFVPLVIGK